MKANDAGYEISPFPKMRRLMVDGGRLAARRHIIHGLLEVDVTHARQYIRDHKARTGETLSFTGFIIYCLGRAVDADRHVHAYRSWRGQLVVFDEVNVNTIVALEEYDHKIHITHILKAVNRRSFRDIHDEIRSFQSRHSGSAELKFIRYFTAMPRFLRDIFYWVIFKNPHWLKQLYGTVAVSAVGMFGEGGGWGIPFVNHSLAVTLGGIAQKPGVVDGRIEIREYLSLTVSFDHDIVDGAPAARFVQHFRELIESAAGLAGE